VPLAYRIDHARRLVWVRASGTLIERDFHAYQLEVWTRPELTGYDELVDMTAVTQMVKPTPEAVRRLAKMSATMDSPTSSKFAVIAPQDLAFGLGRMYEIFRGMEEHSTKKLHVCRNIEDALAFLELPDLGNWDELA
jgi:hypothetical protein